MTEEQPQDAATEPSEQETAPKPKPTETVEFWKQKAREQEGRAKTNADAARRLAEIEDAAKSTEERAAEALRTAEKRAADAEAVVLRLTVASEKGLTPAQAKRLVGSSREELEADADDLLENFKPSTGTEDPAQRVAADLDLGARGTTTAAKGTPEADFEKFLKRQMRA